VVAIQLANTVESVVSILGVLRAGMIAAPIPLLWRHEEMVQALSYIGAKVIITASRIGSYAYADMAMHVAADVFPIRYICAFGDRVGDGVVPLDDIFTATGIEHVEPVSRSGNPAAHIAFVTFDTEPKGLVPIARNHQQLIAGGLNVFLESGGAADVPILSTIPATSFAGAVVTFMPWLLGGGPLHLHHGFDAGTFITQCEHLGSGIVTVPGPTLSPLSQAGLLDNAMTIAALWRSPERLVTAEAWARGANVVDVASFGELGVIAATRTGDGVPLSIPLGRIGSPRGAAANVKTIETARTKNGTLALRGQMVPSQAFPPGAEKSSLPYLVADAEGFVDTGFACKLDSTHQALTIDAPPAGFTSIGAYAFRSGMVDGAVAEVDPDATIVALPDAMLGQRLAGNASNSQKLQAELNARGTNPLITGAFQSRKSYTPEIDINLSTHQVAAE
jgi:hypothetical protein